jgi:hypothetical protein
LGQPGSVTASTGTTTRHGRPHALRSPAAGETRCATSKSGRAPERPSSLADCFTVCLVVQ